MIKAQEVTELTAAVVSACLMHCQKHGAPAAREVLRHLKLAQATPQSARSEALLAEMCAGIEEMLANDAG